MPWPKCRGEHRGDGELWLTVRGVLAADELWAESGTRSYGGRRGFPPRRALRTAPRSAPPWRATASIELGPAVFDAQTGVLRRHRRHRRRRPAPGPVARADRQRDQGRARPGTSRWNRAGARPACTGCTTRRSVSGSTEDGIEVRTRLGAAAVDFGMDVSYRWTKDAADALRLDVVVDPYGTWTVPLPRLGVAVTLPGEYDRRMVRARSRRGVRGRAPTPCASVATAVGR